MTTSGSITGMDRRKLPRLREHQSYDRRAIVAVKSNITGTPDYGGSTVYGLLSYEDAIRCWATFIDSWNNEPSVQIEIGGARPRRSLDGTFQVQNSLELYARGERREEW